MSDDPGFTCSICGEEGTRCHGIRCERHADLAIWVEDHCAGYAQAMRDVLDHLRESVDQKGAVSDWFEATMVSWLEARAEQAEETVAYSKTQPPRPVVENHDEDDNVSGDTYEIHQELREIRRLLDQRLPQSAQLDRVPDPTEFVEDGFGNAWQKCGRSDCGLQVVRPGKAECAFGDTCTSVPCGTRVPND